MSPWPPFVEDREASAPARSQLTVAGRRPLDIALLPPTLASSRRGDSFVLVDVPRVSCYAANVWGLLMLCYICLVAIYWYARPSTQRVHSDVAGATSRAVTQPRVARAR